MNTQDAEIIRKKYKYRKLILEGKLSLPHREAALLIGPDCAYHLYSVPPRSPRTKPVKTSGSADNAPPPTKTRQDQTHAIDDEQ